MRAPSILLLLSFLVACSSAPSSSTPREYLDPQTAATITAVAAPWVFTREGAPPQLDFLHVYALDVNRMGDHRQYLALAQYWPESDAQDAPTLELVSLDTQVALEPLQMQGRQLGIGQHLDPLAPKTTRWWFYSLSGETLDFLARADHLSAALIEPARRSTYVVWRNGSAEAREFAAVARRWSVP